MKRRTSETAQGSASNSILRVVRRVGVAPSVAVLLLVIGFASPFSGQAPAVATVGLSSGWATFGEAVPQGAATTGLQIGQLPTQTDIKNRWPDGSIRFAIVTANVPAAGHYTVTAAAAAAGDFAPTMPSASTTLILEGVTYTATLPSAPAQDSWLSGPLVWEGRSVVTPITAGGTAHDFLRVNFDTRVYRDGTARADVSVENLLDKAGATTVTYDAAITVNHQRMFAKRAVQHFYLTRWRQVFAIGSTPLAAVTPDLGPFTAARALPAYLSLVTDVVSAPTGARYEILREGALTGTMPDARRRAEWAPFPDWTARYLVHRHATQRAFVLANGDLSGSWPVHVREAEDSATSGVGSERLLSLDQRPTLWYDARAASGGRDHVKGTPLPLAEPGSIAPGAGQTALIPDNAHQPSLAYVPYLLTGDRYYAEEMAFWANYGMLRTGDTDGLRGAGGILAANGAGGYAWALRNLADAAAYYPDASPVRAYLAGKVTANLQWLDAYATAVRSTAPAPALWPVQRPDGTPVTNLTEQDALAYAIDRASKQGFAGGLTHRDAIATARVQLPSTRVSASPETRLVLMIGIENGWSGAEAAYDAWWRSLGAPSSSGRLADLAQRAGWALDFSVPDVSGSTATSSPAPAVSSSDTGVAPAGHGMTHAAMVGMDPTTAAAGAPTALPESIPDFSQDNSRPSVLSAQSGNWSSPATWQGGQVPTATHVVRVVLGHTVAINDTSAVAYTVAVDGTLAFAPTVNTRLKVTNLQVMAGDMGMGTRGVLEVGTPATPIAADVTAEIVIANSPIGGSVADPLQFGTGIIVFGKATMHGSVRTPTFVRLATEPRAGHTTLTLSEAVSGWKIGDRLVLPDTRHIKESEVTGGGWINAVNQWEERTVQAISADGMTLTLSSGLQYDHLGARDLNGVLDFLPHVGNLTRNVIIRSESPTGTRGHTLFNHLADVDTRYVLFKDLGRTTYQPLSTEGGSASNHIGRYPVHFHHTSGPLPTPANGYQFTLLGNAVDGGSVETKFKWGITVHGSHYGLIQDNVVYNYNGASIATEDGSESFNVFDHNFVLRGMGEPNNSVSEARMGLGTEGVGFWLRGPNNYIRNNVAANYQNSTTEAAYGYAFQLRYLGNIAIPNFKGADTIMATGQSTTVSGHSLPLLQFENNEAYGAMQGGFTLWWVSSQDPQPTANAQNSLIKDLKVWNTYNKAVYMYPSQKIIFDGLIIRGSFGSTSRCCGNGIYFADYSSKGIVVRNSDIQGMEEGITAPEAGFGPEPNLIIENSYLRNNVNVAVPTNGSVNGCWMDNKLVVMSNTRFDAPPGRSLSAISMVRDVAYAPECLSKLDEARVYAYNGVATDNFQVYHTSSSVVPRPPGSCSPTTRAGINGLLCPIAAQGPVVPTATLSASPTSITAGAAATLTWSTNNATTVSINQGIGSVAVSGTRSVSPASTTTYTLTATNAAGPVTAAATVTVTTGTNPNSKDRANAYDDAWQAGANGWAANAQAILAGGTGQVGGMVLWIGDSLTRDPAMGAWAQNGLGKTAEDQLITNWMHAGLSPQSIDSIDGFALAAPYICSARSYTVGDGLGAWHFMGSSSMPADTNPTTARQKLQDCTTYPNALNLTTMLSALPKAQFAIPEVNLAANNPGLFPDFERMVDLLISKGIVPIIITYTYRNDAAFNLLVDQYNVALVQYAQTKKLPLIDFNQEMLARLPFSQWTGRFLSSDGTHYSRGTTTYPSTADPYASGGDPATHTTGPALTYNGYGLKGWLGVQKMKEIKQLVVDAAGPSLPTATMSASPASITPGASTTLTWSTANATTVSINQGIGSVAVSGTLSVSPTVTTIYTLTATNAVGSVTATASVTVSLPDTTPPVISTVASSGPTTSGATIGFTTNEPSYHQVEYGPTATYGTLTALDTTLRTSHSQSITGLTPGTLYHYRARATDAAGNTGTSGSFTFTTPTTPPPSNLAVGTVVSADGAGTTVTPLFSTAAAGELLVAFASADGPENATKQTLTVSGAGLTWTLVRRNNAQFGTAEIWTATAPAPLANVAVTATAALAGFTQSVTVVTFVGAGGTGATGAGSAATGPSSVSLTTTSAGSLVYGVGNDSVRPVVRILAANQTMVHQWFGGSEAFWVQSLSAAVATAGSVATVSNTGPTSGRWNYTAVEIVAAATGPAPVVVPNVVSQTQAAATTAITGAGLVVGTVTNASSATEASGSVISSSPVAGTQVAATSAVNLVVSTGPAPVAVPNVVGQTEAAATTAIAGVGLVVGTVTSASSTTVPSGSVISSSPVAGTQVAAGSAVDLVVSTGPAPVAVPNVVGQTQAAATTAIAGAGLVVGVTNASSATVPSGSVISQNPVGSTQVATGSTVNLVVSTGSTPPPPPPTTVSIWSATAAPSTFATTDGRKVELGLKFRSDVAGTVTGVRFYKGTTTTGTHTGTLWSLSGVKLASATFTGETASGWQTVTFSSPVGITANTVYVVSYHTNVGQFAYTHNTFATAGVDNGPLHALRAGVSGGNGVFRYGGNAFPKTSFNSSNYWVDVLFVASTALVP